MEYDSDLLWTAGYWCILVLACLTCVGFCVCVYFLLVRTSFSFSAFIRNKDYYDSLHLDDLDSLLGNDDSILDSDSILDKDKSDLDVSKEDLKANKIPQNVQKVLDEEERNNDIFSPDYNLSKIYQNWITSIPWGVASEDKLDIGIISDILDKEHHGLEDVKERILEFIAVSQLKGSLQGKVLCFSGPPGVGKTSIAKSIAHALNRKFFRFSVGGLSDVAELKGHRRTYVSQPVSAKLLICHPRLKFLIQSNCLIFTM